MAQPRTKTKAVCAIPKDTIILWGTHWLELRAGGVALPLQPNDPTGVPLETALGIALAPNIEVQVMY